jgi:hypothetical protein
VFFGKKEEFNVDKFWQDYEAKINEKVLARSLAQYLKGWAEYTQPLWGLAIATTGGFRFHHFPHEGWMTALSRVTSGAEAPKEKTFFIPRKAIQSVELTVENRWWKKLLFPSNPALVIRCCINGAETAVVVEMDQNAKAVADALKNQLADSTASE